jgi:hypothetical protein
MKTLARISAVITFINLLTGCLLDESLKQRNTAVPEQPGDAWEISSSTIAGMDETLLAEVYDMFPDRNGLLRLQLWLLLVDRPRAQRLHSLGSWRKFHLHCAGKGFGYCHDFASRCGR